MTKLQLSPTIRTATIDEVDDIPNKSEHIEFIKNSESANIVEGYKIVEVDKKVYTYSFFAEININNKDLWALFSKLMMSMPDEISLITGHREGEPEDIIYNNYEDKYSLLNFLAPYQKQLSQDSFIEFGVIHQLKEALDEVYVPAAKYIRYWGSDLERFRDIMHTSFSIYETPNIDFIDCYPMMRLPYNELYPEELTTEELLEKLRVNKVDDKDE